MATSEIYFRIKSGSDGILQFKPDYARGGSLHNQVPTVIETPTTVGGVPVKGIDDEMFWRCSHITSITISEGVTSIRYRAFDECSNLTTVNFPTTLLTIGESAFEACEKLTGVVLPPTLTKLGQWAFSGCKALTSIEVPGQVSEVGTYVFSGCNSLNYAVWRAPYIPTGTFSRCYNLRNITIRHGVEWIGSEAFYDCVSLTFVDIPTSVYSIAADAFYECSALNEIWIRKPEGSISGSPWGADAAQVTWIPMNIQILVDGEWRSVAYGGYIWVVVNGEWREIQAFNILVSGEWCII